MHNPRVALETRRAWPLGCHRIFARCAELKPKTAFDCPASEAGYVQPESVLGIAS